MANENREFPGGKGPSWIRRNFGALLLTGASLAMLAWSWKKWPDDLSDFGRELYMAWRLCEGDHLYRDIIHDSGPLSAYVNATAFQLFGTGLDTIVALNLAVLAGILALLYNILRELSDRFSAIVACLAFVLLFAFGQLASTGNYNYVCPYRHEMTHGMLLSLAAIRLLMSCVNRPRPSRMAGAGVCLGLLFLTRGELFLAAALASALGLICILSVRREPSAGARALVPAFVAGAAAPPVLAFAALSAAMPWRTALEGVLGSWPLIVSPGISLSPFYRHGMGTDAPAANLGLMLAWSLSYAILFVPALLAAWRPAPSASARRWLGAAFFGSVLLLAALCFTRIPWAEVARPLPLAMLLLCAACVQRVFQEPAPTERRWRMTGMAMMSMFALVLLGKMFLNVRLSHYGFVLAMPATALTIVVLVSWIPASLARRHWIADPFRATALGLLVVVILVSLLEVRFQFSQKTVRVGTGRDWFWAGPRGDVINNELAEIARQTRPGDTLTSLPHAAILNYLARRRSTLPWMQLAPYEIPYYGEDRIVGALEARPPDFIAIAHFDMSEYGCRFFGTDFARQTGLWIEKNYAPVSLAGSWPLRDEKFGILLLARKPAAAGNASHR